MATWHNLLRLSWIKDKKTRISTLVQAFKLILDEEHRNNFFKSVPSYVCAWTVSWPAGLKISYMCHGLWPPSFPIPNMPFHHPLTRSFVLFGADRLPVATTSSTKRERTPASCAIKNCSLRTPNTTADAVGRHSTRFWIKDASNWPKTPLMVSERYYDLPSLAYLL